MSEKTKQIIISRVFYGSVEVGRVKKVWNRI